MIAREIDELIKRDSMKKKSYWTSEKKKEEKRKERKNRKSGNTKYKYTKWLRLINRSQ